MLGFDYELGALPTAQEENEESQDIDLGFLLQDLVHSDEDEDDSDEDIPLDDGEEDTLLDEGVWQIHIQNPIKHIRWRFMWK